MELHFGQSLQDPHPIKILLKVSIAMQELHRIS